MANIVLRPCCAGWKLLPEQMRGYPWFMVERPMVLAIVVVLVMIAFVALGVLFSGYGNCC